MALEVGPKDWCPCEEGESGHRWSCREETATSGQTQREAGSRECSDAVTDQGTERLPEVGKGRDRPSPGAWEGACSCPHLGGGLLAARRGEQTRRHFRPQICGSVLLQPQETGGATLLGCSVPGAMSTGGESETLGFLCWLIPAISGLQNILPRTRKNHALHRPG